MIRLGLAGIALLALSAPVDAAPMSYVAVLVEDGGAIHSAGFSLDPANLTTSPSLVEVTEFIALVDGVTYTSGQVNPSLAFDGVGLLDATGNLAFMETPSLSSVGMPSTTNVRLLRDGIWEANTCIPLPSCNPDALFGSYRLTLIPEPTPGLLLGLGLVFLAWMRRWTQTWGEVATPDS